MGLYNFQKRFVPFILSGKKTHTIRAIRAHPDKPGNILHLYTGLRQKDARLLMRVPCVRVEEIRIEPVFTEPGSPLLGDGIVWIDGEELDEIEKEALAVRDGFEDFSSMLHFWNGRLPFTGHIIHWTLPKSSAEFLPGTIPPKGRRAMSPKNALSGTRKGEGFAEHHR